MFNRASRSQQDPDIASVKGAWAAKVGPVVGSKAKGAVDWATPHVQRGREAAVPQVQAAVERMTPTVEAARVKIDDLMPRLVEAVTAAAAAGAAASVTAGEYRARSGDAVAVLKGEAVAKRPRPAIRRAAMLVPILAAAGAAGFAALKSRAPKEDPWAVPTGTYPAYTPPAPAAEPAVSTTTTIEPTATVLGTGVAADALDGDSTASVPGLSSEFSSSTDGLGNESVFNDSVDGDSLDVDSIDGDSLDVDSIDVTDASTSAEPYDPTAPGDRI